MQEFIRRSERNKKMVMQKSVEILQPIVQDAIDSASQLGYTHIESISYAQATIENRCPSVERVVSNWAIAEGVLPTNAKVQLIVKADGYTPPPNMKFTVGLLIKNSPKR